MEIEAAAPVQSAHWLGILLAGGAFLLAYFVAFLVLELAVLSRRPTGASAR